MSNRFASGPRSSMPLLQLLETLALALWIGCMTGFAFLFAPIAFHTIGNLNLFAALIGATVHAICNFGFLLGGIALVASALQQQNRLSILRQCCILLMLLATFYEQHTIVPAMEQTLHSLGPTLATVPYDAPLRQTYDALHQQSSFAFGITLILGTLGLALRVFDSRQLSENPGAPHPR